MEDVATGKLHLKLEWLSLLPTPEKLDQVQKSHRFADRHSLHHQTILYRMFFLSQALMTIKADRGQANDGLSSALLVVFLDSARNLPVSQSGQTSQHASAVIISSYFLSTQRKADVSILY